jgi:hypothetical protein
MKQNTSTQNVQEIMRDYSRMTGLEPISPYPQRYLWTDAFSVCNYLELFSQTKDETYLTMALRLVDQVHHTLGRNRDDDDRSGWISGLDEHTGELHPTAGGLRIGKKLPERRPDEPPNERLEWERDGQYYHYLTKWMHTLNRVTRVTGDPTYLGWAMELARTAHARFTYLPASGNRKRMFWKMSIDLTYPLVPSMGQHDPLDGFVTYSELQATAMVDFGKPVHHDLSAEIADMAGICQRNNWVTDDPLGIGGLLFDAVRIVQLIVKGGFRYGMLLEDVVDSALSGMEAYSKGSFLSLPAEYRLAFRELGLSIGLHGVELLREEIEEHPGLFGRKSPVHQAVDTLLEYVPLAEEIERFWMERKNRETLNWTDHREINTVMLATSLAPRGFLAI